MTEASKPRKLYVVSVEAEMLVVAESAEQAKELAFKNGEFEWYQEDYRASEMTHMPAAWDEDSIPFGLSDESEPDRTVGGWLAAGAAKTYVMLRDQAKRRKEREKK
jgi:hypothetical protein